MKTLEHSPIGASSMYRWSVCAGSVQLSQGIEIHQSAYAEEGTQAHALAAHCLREKKLAAAFIGQTLTFSDCVVTVDRVMAEYVQVYLDYIDSKIAVGDTLYVEHEFNLKDIYPGCWGTADAVIWKPFIETLVVPDFKYGAGILVMPNNPQNKYYALGAIITLPFRPKKVELVIVQPRCEHPDGPIRSYVIDAMDLLDFSVDLQDYAKATEDPKAPLVSGDHCRFCPAARICPELTKQTNALAKMEFKQGLSYDPAKLSLALKMIPGIEAQIKALDAFAYQEAEAGRCPPGFKLVDKRGTWKWKDKPAAEAAFIKLAPKRADIYEPKVLKSPAQMEKVLNKKVVEEHATIVSSGHTLAEESDKRPAVRPTAAQAFENVSAEPVALIGDNPFA